MEVSEPIANVLRVRRGTLAAPGENRNVVCSDSILMLRLVERFIAHWFVMAVFASLVCFENVTNCQFQPRAKE